MKNRYKIYDKNTTILIKVKIFQEYIVFLRKKLYYINIQYIVYNAMKRIEELIPINTPFFIW